MQVKPDYDVLRLIQHKGTCYVSSDNVKGCLLEKWLKFHPYMSKDGVTEWICDMVRQLSEIHKCSGNPEYQYVNPYSIIVTKEKTLCFLDVGSSSNRGCIRRMKNPSLESYFCPEQELGKLMSGEERDIYGLGKTIQYLLAFTDVEPRFSKREERRLKRMIMRCVDPKEKKKFYKVEEIQNYLFKYFVK